MKPDSALCRKNFTSFYVSPCLQAKSIPSIRWKKLSERWASAASMARTESEIGRWHMNTRSRRNCSRSPMSGNRPNAMNTLSPPKERPKRSPIYVTSTRFEAPRTIEQSNPWHRTDSASWRLRKHASAAITGRQRNMISISNFSV